MIQRSFRSRVSIVKTSITSSASPLALLGDYMDASGAFSAVGGMTNITTTTITAALPSSCAVGMPNQSSVESTIPRGASAVAAEKSHKFPCSEGFRNKPVFRMREHDGQKFVMINITKLLSRYFCKRLGVRRRSIPAGSMTGMTQATQAIAKSLGGKRLRLEEDKTEVDITASSPTSFFSSLPSTAQATTADAQCTPTRTPQQPSSFNEDDYTSGMVCRLATESLEMELDDDEVTQPIQPVDKPTPIVITID